MACPSSLTEFLRYHCLQFTHERIEVQAVNYNSHKGHLLSAYFQTDSMLSILPILSHLILSGTLMRHRFYRFILQIDLLLRSQRLSKLLKVRIQGPRLADFNPVLLLITTSYTILKWPAQFHQALN